MFFFNLSNKNNFNYRSNLTCNNPIKAKHISRQKLRTMYTENRYFTP